jgi:hypothetical protein
MKYSIQVNYNAQDKDDKQIRARSTFWTEADDVGKAYESARESFAGQNVKFGACIPGHHNHF